MASGSVPVRAIPTRMPRPVGRASVRQHAEAARRIGQAPEAGGFARLDHGLTHRDHEKSREKPGRVRQVRADAP